ncbi:MAG: hypothetical protein ACP5UD_08625 [Conexivisphaera sp.]
MRDNGCSVSLYYEYRLNGEAQYRDLRGRVYGWRRAAFNQLLMRLNVSREVRAFNAGSRLSIFIRVLPQIGDVRDAYRALDVVATMGIEEAAFWVWKLNAAREYAARAFKAMYRLR